MPRDVVADEALASALAEMKVEHFNDPDRWAYTVQEVGDALGISHWTLRGWIADRRVAVIRLGRSVRIPKERAVRLRAEGLPTRPSTPTEAT